MFHPVKTYYTKNSNNKFFYICSHCGYVHNIDNDFYIYDYLKQNKKMQDTCFHCDEVFYLEPKENEILHKTGGTKND